MSAPRDTPPPRTLGVMGSGVMGAGIAQLGCLAGMRTLLFDSSEQALEAAVERIGKDLERGAKRERWSTEEAAAAIGQLETVADVAALAPAELVIEAVPENLEIKAEALSALPGDPVIATNTSSLSVTAIAAQLERPERVVGMHFFNPPPLMALVELVSGSETDPACLELARATALAMKRVPIVARDAIGFVVNRGGRPFYTEAQRLLEEGIAGPAQIDRLYRLGAGFRMGPFELMDLVGLDTGLAVADVFTARSLGEPRWKPGATQRRMVTAGRFGRKNGRGWYDYRDGPHREDDPPAPAGHGGAGRSLVVLGDDAEAQALRGRAEQHGFAVSAETPPGEPPFLTLVTDRERAGDVPAGPVAVSCARASLAAAGPTAAVGFHVLPPAVDAGVLELTSLSSSSAEARAAVEELASALGMHAEWVGDAPGLVLGRVIPQLVNESCFAVGEGVASAEDFDLGLTLGLNHPHGPIAWGDRLGWDAVLARVDGIWDERREERYRAAPMLRRAAALQTSVRTLLDPDQAHPAWA